MRRTKLKTYRVTIVEVLVHTAVIKATSRTQATELANDRWDENGDAGFCTQTLGRTETVINEGEVQP